MPYTAAAEKMLQIIHVFVSLLKVDKHCGDVMKYGSNTLKPKKVKAGSAAPDIVNGDLYISGDSQNIYAKLPTATTIENQLNLVRSNLSKFKSHFGNLSAGLCVSDGLASLDNANCWNGTTQGRLVLFISIMLYIVSLQIHHVVIFCREALTAF